MFRALVLGSLCTARPGRARRNLSAGRSLARYPDRAPIEAFVAADPYVQNGLVSHWEIGLRARLADPAAGRLGDWYVVIADDPMPV